MLLSGEQQIKQQTCQLFKDHSRKIRPVRKGEYLLMKATLHKLYFIIFSAHDRLQSEMTGVILMDHQMFQDFFDWIEGLKYLIVSEVIHLLMALGQSFFVLFEQNSTREWVLGRGMLQGSIGFYFMDGEQVGMRECFPLVQSQQGRWLCDSKSFKDHVGGAVGQNEMLMVLFDDLEESMLRAILSVLSDRPFRSFSYHQILLSSKPTNKYPCPYLESITDYFLFDQNWITISLAIVFN